VYVLLLLVVREHDRDPVPQGEVLPGEVKPLPAFVRPDCANTRPNFLAGLVFARGFTVVKDM